MNQVEALAKLKVLRQPLFVSKDIAAHLGVTRFNATKIGHRLAKAGHLIKLGRGKWGLAPIENTLAIPEHLTSPFPAYVSLQSALYLHGLISQIPHMTYAISLGRSRRCVTPVGTFSIHHVEPRFFFGFELSKDDTAKIAVPEKALVDLFYLSPARSRLFTKLPELNIPKNFSWRRARQMTSRIQSHSRRRLVEEKLSILQNRVA